MGKLSGPEVAQVAYNAGWRGKDLLDAVSVSFAECPAHDEYCYNGSCCYGLWQVSRVHFGAGTSLGCVTQAQCNANYAYRLWRQQGWGPWTTWPVAARLHRNAARKAIQAANLEVGGQVGIGGTTPGGQDCAGIDTSQGCAQYDKLGCLQGATGDALKACLEKQPKLSTCFACAAVGAGAKSLETSSGCQSSSLAGGIVCVFTSLEDAVKAVVGAALFLLSPSHWVRIAETVGGAILVLLAIVFLFLYSHRDEVKGIAKSAGGAAIAGV